MEEEVIELRAIVTTITGRLQELEQLVLTFRQAQLIMLAGSDKFLKKERTVEPKHRNERKPTL